MRLPDEPEMAVQINIVPMIDVIFAILTFFIMSSLFLSRVEGLSKISDRQPPSEITVESSQFFAHSEQCHGVLIE
jgi:biopolymer transport protein ExbD